MAAPCMFRQVRLQFRHMSLAISSNGRSPGTPQLQAEAQAQGLAKPLPRAEPVPLRTRKDSFEPSADAGLTSYPSTTSDQQAEGNRAFSKPSTSTAEQLSGSEPASSPGSPEPTAEKPKAIGQQLTPDDVQVISNLQARDREVRAHEAAHQAAGGGTVGGASFSYQQGPDGRQYAIGGEVSVDLSASGSPEAVIAKMARVRAAATAPANPSSQDFSVAAAAASIAAEARQDQRAQVVAEQSEVTATKQKKAEVTAESDAQAAQVGASTSLPPGASTDEASEKSADIPQADDRSASQRTQQKVVSAYQISLDAANKNSINQYA